MGSVLGSFSKLLKMTSQTFLLEDKDDVKHSELLKATQEHQASFTSLKKNLVEAKTEWMDKRMSAPRNSKYGEDVDLYDAVVAGLNRLAQHLNGLRDGTRQQQELIRQGTAHRSRSDKRDSNGSTISGKANGYDQTKESRDVTILMNLVDDMSPPMSALAVRAKSSWLDETNSRQKYTS